MFIWDACFFFSFSGKPDNWLSVTRSIVHEKDSTFHDIFYILNAIWYMALFDACKSQV